VSVLMVLQVPADAAALERAASENRDLFMSISADARSRGAIHHDFYEGDGEVWVVDEWDSPESFQSFFADNGEKIGQLMGAAGVQGEPGPPQFYRKLSLGDEF